MVGRAGGRSVTRPFAAGAFVFTVTTDDDADRETVETLFQDVPRPPPTGAEPAAFTLQREGTRNAAWILGSPRSADRRTPTLEAALSLLLSDVNLCALDAEPEYLHLHAAAAVQGGRAVVIAAARNTGKTTTVAHLVARGWRFVTDETVRLDDEANGIGGFPKPISIKPGGVDLLHHLDSWMIPAADDWAGTFRYVPLGASGAILATGGTAHLVVLLRQPPLPRPITEPRARLLHPADAVVALMQETLDAERFGPASARLAALAASTRCVELVIGSPVDTAAAIEALFALDPVDALDVRVLPASEAFSTGVVSIAIGDRAVVHDTASGRIFALDAGGTRVWGNLGGWTADTGLDLQGPVVKPFLAELRALGVLAGAA
jgi:hypothetical protein